MHRRRDSGRGALHLQLHARVHLLAHAVTRSVLRIVTTGTTAAPAPGQSCRVAAWLPSVVSVRPVGSRLY